MQKFDSSGNFLLTWGQNGNSDGRFQDPQGIAVDNYGYVYVADTKHDRIQKFNSSTGEFLGKWGTTGSGNGQFKNPYGIGMDNYNNYMYIADGTNNRVQKFSIPSDQYAVPAYISQWGTTGSGNGQFLNPQDSVVDVSGYIYVVDLSRNDVQKFNGSVNPPAFVSKWGSQGSGNGQFQSPIGISTSFTQCASASEKCYLISSIFDTGTGGVSQDPILSNWVNTSSFAVGTSEHASVVYNGYVYVIGGQGGAGTNVYYAPLNSNGSVGTWNTTTSLPAMRQAPTSVVYNGYVYVIGGYSGSYQSTVYYAQLNANGTVGAWNTTTALPGPRYRATSAVYNGYVYVLGGRSSGSTYQSTVYYAQLNTNGTVGAWSTGTAMPTTLNGHSTAVNNGYLYAIGGYNGSYQSTVYYAQINANGSIGAWTTNTNALPAARAFHDSIVLNNYIYAIAGNNSSAVPVATFVYAPINGNGSIGTWSSGSIPAARQSPEVVANAGHVYLIGGYNSGEKNTVYYSSPVTIAGGAGFNTIMWQGSQLSGQLIINIASSNNSGGPWNYTSSLAPSGPNVQVKIPTEHTNRRYIRYKAVFDSNQSNSPRVDDIILNWSP